MRAGLDGAFFATFRSGSVGRGSAAGAGADLVSAGAGVEIVGRAGRTYSARIRTDGRNAPQCDYAIAAAPPQPTGLTHVVVTHQQDGLRIYINGALAADVPVGGYYGDWTDRERLSLIDGLQGEAQWLGTLHFAALYRRALGADEVAANYTMGSRP